MTINRLIKLSAIIFTSLSLQGCFWGFFGGEINVQNDTDRTISVSMDDPDVDDGGYYFDDRSIDSGDNEYFPLSSLTFRPKVYVEYKGIHKTYRTSLNFFGYDVVYVNSEDFTAPHD